MKRMECLSSNHATRAVALAQENYRVEVNANLRETPVSTGPLSKKQLVALMDYGLSINLSWEGAQYNEENEAAQKIVIHSPLPGANATFHYVIRNQFLGTAYYAFEHHIGFVLSPSQLFLLILQQISRHVSTHAEELRDQFVQFDGKRELFLEVSPQPALEEWSRAMRNFRQQIATNTISDTYELFSLGGFSTTTEVEQVISDITLMDTCQSYFDFNCVTSCGIPFYILQGSVEDWELLREKAEQVILRKTLHEFSSRWLMALLPILDKIILTRRGEEVDLLFWKSFFKVGEKFGSGGYTFISGWVNSFFPMTSESDVNPYCVPLEVNPLYVQYLKDPESQQASNSSERDRIREPVTGMDISKFPSGNSMAPISWRRFEELKALEVFGGFVGGIYEDRALRVEVGWWIAEK